MAEIDANIDRYSCIGKNTETHPALWQSEQNTARVNDISFLHIRYMKDWQRQIWLSCWSRKNRCNIFNHPLVIGPPGVSEIE